MNLVEMNEAILTGSKKQQKVPVFNQEQLIGFKKLLKVSNVIEGVYEETEDSNSFFSMFPDIKKVAGGSVSVEMFYAAKTGFYYPGVPARLIYILNKLFAGGKYESINASLNSAIKLLQLYCKSSWKYGEETVTMKDVIENITGKSVTLLTVSVPKTDANGVYEVWVPNVERVALLPQHIYEKLSYQDCEKIEYTPDGLSLNGMLLRTFSDRLGITKSDFDLRECL